MLPPDVSVTLAYSPSHSTLFFASIQARCSLCLWIPPHFSWCIVSNSSPWHSGEFWLCVFLNADTSGSAGLRAPTFWLLTSISSPLLLSFLPKPTSLLFFWISVYFRVILEKYRKNRNIVQGVSMAQFPLLLECDITMAYLNPCWYITFN